MSDRPNRDAKGKVSKRPSQTSRSTREGNRTREHSGRPHRRGSRQNRSNHDPAAAGVMTANPHGDSAPTDHVAVAHAPALTASTEFHSSVSHTGSSTYGSVGMQQAQGSEADMTRVQHGASPQEHTTPRPYYELDTEFRILRGYEEEVEEEVDDHPTVETTLPLKELLTVSSRLALGLGEDFEKWRHASIEDSEHPQQ